MENNTLGSKIKQIRRIKEKTQKDLADVLGCSEAQISHIENGNRNISMDDLKKISDFLGVSYDAFFSKNSEFVNFRHDKNSEHNFMPDDLIDDFKKYAKNKIYGNQK